MTHSFIPGSGATRELRGAFGRFATGVTVVTANSARGPIGITANSFTSVSLDPAMLLWCQSRASQRHDSFVGAEKFALHVMARAQDRITWAFATSAEAFEHCDYTLSEDGVPLIHGCPARFECTTHERVAAGDHTVIIARIDKVTLAGEPDARVFLGAEYGRFVQD